jgi:hypothetical protein
MAVSIVVCALLSYPCLSLSALLVRTAVPALGAAYGLSGEEGTLTVTDRVRGSGRSPSWQCVGDFAPAAGGPVLEGVGAEVGRCGPESVGTTGRALLVHGREDADWFSWGRGDRAYAQTGFGNGAAVPLFVLLVPNLIALALGLGLAYAAVGLCLEAVADALWRSRRAPDEPGP